MLSKQGHKRPGASSLTALAAAANANAKQARHSSPRTAARPPLRGATASRTKALATLGRLVAESMGAAVPPPERRRSTVLLAHGQPAAPGASGGAALHAQATQQAPLTGNGSPTSAPRAPYGAASPPAAAPSCAAGSGPARCAAPPPLTPSKVAAQLRQLADALQGVVQRMAQRSGSYLYQHAENLAVARKQLAACDAALSALPPGRRAAGIGSGGRGWAGQGEMQLTVQLRDACAACWVS
jgi:hypothetical protein